MDQSIYEFMSGWIRQIKYTPNTPKGIILEFDTVESERYAEKNIEENIEKKSLIYTTLKMSKNQSLEFVNLKFTICSTGMTACGVDPIDLDPTFKLDKDFDNSAFGL